MIRLLPGDVDIVFDDDEDHIPVNLVPYEGPYDVVNPRVEIPEGLHFDENLDFDAEVWDAMTRPIGG